MIKKGVLVLILAACVKLAMADISDTIIAIEPVVAKGVKFDQLSVGTKSIEVDTFQLKQYRTSSLADLLQQQSVVNITSYGPGGLAGIKMRGGSADHTTIIWNGLNIKPPMSGEMNLSSVNAGLFESVSVQPGASSTMYGTGAATGVVAISNALDFKNKGVVTNVGTEVGSFNTIGLNASTQYINAQFGTRLAVSYQNSENNFSYINTDRFGDPLDTLKHASYKTLSLVQQNVIKFNASTSLETDLWYSNHHKLIPSSTTSTLPGKNEQSDENIHFALNFAKYGNNWFVKYRGGVLYYSIDFLNHYGNEDHLSLNKSWSYINEIESKYKISSEQIVFLGINNTLNHAVVESYSESPWRNSIDLFGRYYLNTFNNYLKINLEARESVVDGSALPFVYSAGMEVKTIKGFTVKMAGAKLYNLPDLNDLYWANTGDAVGNPLLQPEYGWNAEVGIQQAHTFNTFVLKNELTVYRNQLHDAIVWAEDSSAKWMPNNHKKSKTSGLEFMGSIQKSIHKSMLTFGYEYVYTNAQLLSELNGSSKYFSKVYIPKHKAGVRLMYAINDFSAAIYSQYVGERPKDNSSGTLEQYSLVDIYLNYELNICKTHTLVYLKIKNVFNTNYKLRPGFAQAMRGVYVGFNCKF